MMSTVFHRAFTFGIVLICLVCLGMHQWEDPHEKRTRRLQAEAELAILSGDFSTSLSAYRALQSADSNQPGFSRLVPYIESLLEISDSSEQEVLLAQLAEEALLQQRYLLAEQISLKLMRENRRYFDHEQRLYLARWLRTGNPGQQPPFDYYSSRDLWRLYRQILLTVPTPHINTYDFSYEERTGEYLFSCIVNRVFMEDRLRVQWSLGEHEQDGHQWFFGKFAENVLIETKTSPAKDPAVQIPVQVSVFYQNTPLLVIRHPSVLSSGLFFDVIYPKAGTGSASERSPAVDETIAAMNNDRADTE